MDETARDVIAELYEQDDYESWMSQKKLHPLPEAEANEASREAADSKKQRDWEEEEEASLEEVRWEREEKATLEEERRQRE